MPDENADKRGRYVKADIDRLNGAAAKMIRQEEAERRSKLSTSKPCAWPAARRASIPRKILGIAHRILPKKIRHSIADWTKETAQTYPAAGWPNRIIEPKGIILNGPVAMYFDKGPKKTKMQLWSGRSAGVFLKKCSSALAAKQRNRFNHFRSLRFLLGGMPS